MLCVTHFTPLTTLDNGQWVLHLPCLHRHHHGFEQPNIRQGWVGKLSPCLVINWSCYSELCNRKSRCLSIKLWDGCVNLAISVCPMVLVIMVVMVMCLHPLKEYLQLVCTLAWENRSVSIDFWTIATVLKFLTWVGLKHHLQKYSFLALMISYSWWEIFNNVWKF